MTEILYPTDGFVFDTYTDEQREFVSIVKERGIDEGLEWIKLNRTHDLSFPRSLEFVFPHGNSENMLEISEQPDFSSVRTYRTNREALSISNLKTGTRYFFRANGGGVKSFTTLPGTPRFLEVGGLLNVRDIGGGKIKQGILFRGCELEHCFPITEEGKETFLSELGIKTQLDLRLEMKEKITKSAAGDTVNFVQLPYRPYDEVFLPEHVAGIRPIMELFANPDNYPIYFHCMGGADRTGMIAIYLRALAGEDDETIHLDYELTGISTYAGGIKEGATGLRSRNAEYYREFIKRIKSYAYDDAPLNIAVYAFLKSCGVSAETLDKIIEIIKA